MTNTTTASKYIPRRARICINWNPPFKTQIYFVKARPSVNIVKEDLHNSLKQFLTNLWSEVWKGDFNWCCGSICQLSPSLHFYSDWPWPYCVILRRKIHPSTHSQAKPFWYLFPWDFRGHFIRNISAENFLSSTVLRRISQEYVRRQETISQLKLDCTN